MLLLPALLSFALEHRLRSRQQEQASTRSVPYISQPHPVRDTLAFIWCATIALLFIALAGMAIYGSLIRFWPYDLSLTFANYDFDSGSVYGWLPFLNTLKLGFLTALAGTLILTLLAWAQEKGRHFAPYVKCCTCWRCCHWPCPVWCSDSVTVPSSTILQIR
ncbi:hypothetical protein PCI56_02570 [Plesiomonas shigelloides subsp. oncorhynchi]|nr:hypothetical protein [Plesiomonas shigelloides]